MGCDMEIRKDCITFQESAKPIIKFFSREAQDNAERSTLNLDSSTKKQ